MRLSLQNRLIALVALAMVLMLGMLGTFAFLSVRSTVDGIVEQRVNLAGSVAAHVESVLERDAQALDDVTTTLAAEPFNVEVWRVAVHDFYVRSVFSSGIMLLDASGLVLLDEPVHTGAPQDLSLYPHVREAIETRRPVVSNYYQLSPLREPIVSVVIPRTREGKVVGIAMGNIDLNALTLRREIQLLDMGESYIDLVDGNGISIASSRGQRVLKPVQNASNLIDSISRQATVQGAFRNSDTGAMEILAFFPLSRLSPMTKWGVAVWEGEQQALIPARALETQFFIAGLVLLALGMLFAWGMGRSIVRPIAMLTRATQRIAEGQLSDPIPVTGADELGRLADSFDAMRRQLKASTERIQQWNRELEKTVHERTQELEQSQVMRGQLLRKLIFAQEEERKRVARELHDETSQALTALVMRLDMALMAPGLEEETKGKLASTKNLAVRVLDGVRRMIFDLRPSVLDDLGLVPALRWYADLRLKPVGVRVSVEITGKEERLSPEVEVAIFRVVQEAITNVGKHAEAENVVLSIDFGESEVVVEVEDDGKGFDPRRLVRIGEKGEGLGLLGMKERVFLLGGSMTVDSEPGAGTRVRVQVPLAKGMVKE